MRILLCADPLDTQRVDETYGPELEAAQAAGFATALLDFEALLEGDITRALRRVAPGDSSPGTRDVTLFRGWMLTSTQYAALYGALAERDIVLINTPQQYRNTHELPSSYDVLAGQTPRSIWLPVAPNTPIAAILDDVMAALTPFGSAPVVVKDFVKSRKHEWADAFYIRDASDRAEVARVAGNFLARQGGDLNEGLVFREFVAFEPVGTHPKSGMPLTREYRIVYLDGAPIIFSQYWDVVYHRPAPPRFRELARRIDSRFFTMDVAQRRDGEWLIVELGDGQVAGLPERMPATRFYAALANKLRDGTH